MIEFEGVDEFIEQQPPEIAELLVRLRFLIHAMVPNGMESIKWKIPFYSYNGLLCYLNPVKNGVALGFYHGTKLADEAGVLTGEGKMVKHVVTGVDEEVPEEGVRMLLQEAMVLNEVLQEAKRKR